MYMFDHAAVISERTHLLGALPTELTIWLVLAADAVAAAAAAAAAAAVTVAALFCVLTLIACLVRCRINFATEIYKQEQTSQSCSIVVRNQSPNDSNLKQRKDEKKFRKPPPLLGCSNKFFCSSLVAACRIISKDQLLSTHIRNKIQFAVARTRSRTAATEML
ncbi:hypothetical protein GQX74_010400 [Glossina fuscipes]|nr:hypothetical protein GQX74_010400 [Glossina fuscipes]